MPYDRGCYADVAAFWGDRLWAFLNETRVMIVMLKGVREGMSPIEAVDAELMRRFGKAVLQERVREFTGFLAGQVVEAYGAKSDGVRLVASRYAGQGANLVPGDFVFNPKILLVDDVKVFMEIQKEFLRLSPVQILTAKNGAEALEVVRREKPDLVVMDVEMPEMDGITCCSAIKRDPQLWSTPVVLISSDGSQEVTEASYRAGCEKFLKKPVFGREFLDMAHYFIPVVERRRPRVPCKVPVTVQVDGGTFEGVTRDIGMNGLYVASEMKVKQGDEVVASFRLPTNTYAVTVARGRVAWTNSPGAAQRVDLPAGFGVEFREITGEGVSHLRFCELGEFVNGYPVLPSSGGRAASASPGSCPL